MNVRSGLRQITPPILLTGWRRLRRRRTPIETEWEYIGREWVNDDDTGWDSSGVVGAYRSKLPSIQPAIARPACIGVATEADRDSEVSLYDQNVILEFVYAVARASAADHVSILDWGGGFGLLSLVVAEMFPDLEVDFHVRELPLIAQAGRDAMPHVNFWDDDTCLERSFDLVNASSSLQYAPRWEDTLTRFASAGRFVLLSRLPVTGDPQSFVVRQRAYGTSYDGWVISHPALLETAERAGLTLDREFIEGWSVVVPGAPGDNEHRAFLFNHRPRDDEAT